MTDALVIGAGMVGVATALALQARGRDVVLVDRREAGRETSYGNAGLIQAEAVEPYAFPLEPSAVFGIALKLTNDVNWHLTALPAYAGPLVRYLWHSTPAHHQAISQVYGPLIRRATADHEPLIEAAGAGNLITKDGFVQAYRTNESMDAGARDAEHVNKEFGVGMRLLSAKALAAEEPQLKRPMAGGVHWTEAWACSSPGSLVAAYLALFEKRGGTFATGDAASLEEAGAGWRVTTADGPVEASDAVVALGPWSQQCLARFGYAVPLFRKRGYHRHYAMATPLRRAFMDTASGVVCAPMQAGMRITTGAELAAFDAPATPRQLRRAERTVAELFDFGEPVEAEPWLGNRPCMPDMLPVVGKAPRHPGLWFHFGHGHQGFTLGPTTAALLAEDMSGEGVNPLAAKLAYRF